MFTDINFYILNLVVISFASIILLSLNLFQVPYALTSGILISISIYYLLHSRQIIRPQDRILLNNKTHGFVLMVIILIALLYRAEPYLWIMGGQDQGSYVNMSAYWEKNKTIFPEDTVRSKIESLELLEYYDKTNKSIQRKTKKLEYLPGIFASKENSEYVFQAYHLHPLWMAVFGKLFGSENRVYSLTLFSILSILFFHLLAYEMSKSLLIAGAAGLLMALNPLHAFFSKFPVTEVVSLFFTTASFYYLLKYYIASKKGDFPLFYLCLSAGLMGCFFFTKINGFMYIPFFCLLLFTNICFVNNKRTKRDLALYCIGLLSFYTISVLYGLTYSRPYFMCIFVDSFIEALGARPLWKLKLLTGPAITILGLLILAGATHKRPGTQKIIKKTSRALIKWLPFIFVIILIGGLYKIYELGFTGKYSGHGYFDIRWNMSGLGFRSIRHSSIIVTVSYISPFLFGLFLYNLFKYRKEDYILSLLLLFVIPFWIYIAFFYWVIPYQYFSARYLLSETVPYTILFALAGSSMLLRKNKMKILFFSLIAFSSCYFGFYSIYQLKGREADGAFESLNKIASYADKNDLILLNKEEFTAYVVIKTPLVYFFGKNIFSFNSANDLKFLMGGELLEKYDDLFVLTQLPIFENYLRLENEVAYTQGLFEHAVRIPRKFSYAYFSPLKLLLYKIDKQVLSADILQETNAIIVKSWLEKKGFHADTIWTKGDAKVFGFEYNPAGKAYILITTYGWNPYKENLEKLGLKLFVNGAVADFSHVDDVKYYFKLPENIGVVTKIRIKSDTFVPEQLGINNDKRLCGIDIKTISFE
jgi:hypothetical protein